MSDHVITPAGKKVFVGDVFNEHDKYEWEIVEVSPKVKIKEVSGRKHMGVNSVDRVYDQDVSIHWFDVWPRIADGSPRFKEIKKITHDLAKAINPEHPSAINNAPECTCDSRTLAIHGCRCSYAEWKRSQGLDYESQLRKYIK